jgi:Spy/CpxP family protein refolding chaperone
MNAVKICLMAALLTAVTVSAFGQQRPASTQPAGQGNDAMGVENPGQPGHGGPMSEEKREEIRKKIDAVRIWRLTEALKLDANTSAKLSSLLSSVDHRRREILREQTGTISILRFAVRAPKPDEAKIKAYLEKLDKNHLEMQELTNSERNGLKNILTIEQQARYVVFQHEFMREMRGMIGSAHGGGMGVGGGAGMGSNQGQTRGGTGQGGTTHSPEK